jgi:hypothetical protein
VPVLQVALPVVLVGFHPVSFLITYFLSFHPQLDILDLLYLFHHTLELMIVLSFNEVNSSGLKPLDNLTFSRKESRNFVV